MQQLPMLIEGATATVFGGIAAARLLTVRELTVTELKSQLDKKLARRLFRLVEANKQSGWTPRLNHRFWQVIGGVRGVPHLVAQVRLMLRIVFEIRRATPELFEFEQGMLDGATRSVVLGVGKSLGETAVALVYPQLRCIGAKVSATVYAHLAAEVENIIAESEYGYLPCMT